MTSPDYDPRPYIAANTWVTARSVPQHPHQYLIAERASDPEGHAQMIAWINATATIARTFAGVRYRYAEVDAFLYWVSRPPSWGGPGLIINRRRVEDVTDAARCPECGWDWATPAECAKCGWKAEPTKGRKPGQARLDL